MPFSSKSDLEVFPRISKHKLERFLKPDREVKREIRKHSVFKSVGLGHWAVLYLIRAVLPLLAPATPQVRHPGAAPPLSSPSCPGSDQLGIPFRLVLSATPPNPHRQTHRSAEGGMATADELWSEVSTVEVGAPPCRCDDPLFDFIHTMSLK